MHIHSLKRAALAACVLAAGAAAPATAATVTTQLRVEANGHDLDPGWRYAHDSASYTTSRSAACGGSGDAATITGPSALGLLLLAAKNNRRLAPVRISDKFEFGPFVCGIGGYASSDARFWLYKVDHVSPEVGADQFAIGRSHRQVLWYFVDTATGSNTGNELELVVENRDVQAGAQVQVRVLEYAPDGQATPAAGVRILDGETVTDSNGEATLVFERAARPVIRGVRGVDVPTDGIRLCVWEESASDCDLQTQGRVVGTDGHDRLRGTAERDWILGDFGNDTITSRGDGVRDVVRCGRGRDTARADALDQVHRSCERVSRR